MIACGQHGRGRRRSRRDRPSALPRPRRRDSRPPPGRRHRARSREGDGLPEEPRLPGAPWIEQQKIDLDAITQETLIFEGSATEACRAFPANVNVVAALSLAGIGPEKTRIKIFAAPEFPLNRHRIVVQGEFGRLVVEVENVPSENPRTCKLSYLSTIALLRELGAPLRVGT